MSTLGSVNNDGTRQLTINMDLSKRLSDFEAIPEEETETALQQSVDDVMHGIPNPAYIPVRDYQIDSTESASNSFRNVSLSSQSNSHSQSHSQSSNSGRRNVVSETTLLMPGRVSNDVNQVKSNGKVGNGVVGNGTVDPQSCLSVLRVNYTVKTRVGPWWKGACFRRVRRKQVLSDITMEIRSGEVTAILGNSGSGKTSLLDVITCRTKGELTGSVLYNNTTCSHDVIQQHAAYVMQADRLLPNLTVRETLRYAARLKLPGTTSSRDIERKVTSVIMEMGLKDVADSRVGNSLIRGISGGEQRRVTIAIQLLKDPDVVLLDEPTSGLDSYTARYLVSNLRHLARRGKIVLLTIHQPSSDIFQFFDQIALMSVDVVLLDEPTSGLDSYTARYLVSNLRHLARRGKIVLLTIHQPSSDIFQFFDQIALMSVGEMVYSGPATMLVPYFTNLGYPCDRYTNPLDRYVDVASIDRRDSHREEESEARVGKLVQEFRDSVLHQTVEDRLLERSQKYSQMGPPPRARVAGPSFPRVMSTILGRINRNLFRDRKDYVARILLLPFFIFFVLIFLGRLRHTQSSIQDRIGLLYNSATAPPFIGMMNAAALCHQIWVLSFLGRLRHTQSSIQDRIGLLYNSATAPPFIGMMNAAALYPPLRDLFYRESVDGLYGTATFLLAYTIHVLPFHIASSIIFSSIMYWVAGLQPDVDKFLYYTLAVFLIQYWGEMLTIATMGIFMNPNVAQSTTSLLQAASVIIGSGYIKNVQSLIKPLQWLTWGLIHKYSAEIFVANEFTDLGFDDCRNVTDACFSSGNEYIERYYPDAGDNMTRNFGAMGGYAVCTLILAIIVYKLIGPKTLH